MHVHSTKYLSLFLVLGFMLNINAVRFIQNPADISTIEGNRVFFFCIVDDLHDSQVVSWMRDDTKLSSGNRIFKLLSTYTVTVDKVVGQYRLMIDPVSRDDGLHKYFCSVFQGSNSILESNSASLTVLEVPANYFPICSPLQTSYLLGATVTLTCKSELTSPLVDLWWIRDRHTLANGQFNIDHEKKVVHLTYSFQPELSDVGTIFTCCLSSSTVFVSRNCSTSPLQIYTNPKVSIQGTQLLTEDKEAIFICHDAVGHI
ncbi:Down syndrome cell adhesion molecule-like [Anneissia japonica]|uniref:Down syndrome cell adhesion molecule-like n=1 Tax=Anneissia japonica TaxID=1529436 RepID=UPI0014258EDA|nr:Down syndrome cell adhesion molecule-like [Anneissia japonica]